MTPWKVLIVDDEEGIHGITRMIFRGYEFEQRPIELISATSSDQAKKFLREQPDIALALLDVVMEQDNTGLLLVEHIRNELNNQDIRIILRTGHPGYAPETQVIVTYDINDYLSKAELSASRLLTSVIVALRSYRDIRSARIAPSQAEGTANQEKHDLLPTTVKHLQSLLSPLLKSSTRLEQMDLNPVAKDLCTNLKAQLERLNINLLLLQNAQQNCEKEVISTSILMDEVLLIFLPQTRQEGWLIDYQIQSPLEQLTTERPVLQALLICSLELALLKAQGNDLKIVLQQTDKQHVKLTVSQTTGHSSFKQTPWAQYLNTRLTSLCSQLGGSNVEAEGSSLTCCLLPQT